MKKPTLKSCVVLLICAFAYTAAPACEFCNCYLPFNPGYNKNSISIQTSIRTARWEPPFTSGRMTHGGGSALSGSGDHVDEFLSTYSLCARYFVVPKLQLNVSIPVTLNSVSYSGVHESRLGLGDLRFFALYQVANTKTTDSLKTRHRFFAGAGIKLATGVAEAPDDVTVPMAEDLYAGTGSTDYMLLAEYMGKRGRIGWNALVSYKLNGESCNDYRYGNTFNMAPTLFYEFGNEKLKFYPHAGAAYQNAAEDAYSGDTQAETGGSLLFATAGIDSYFGAFSLTTEAMLPVMHDVGKAEPEDRFGMNLTLNFYF